MKHKNKRIPRILAAITIFTLLFASLIALADPGDLDTTFDTDGIVTTPVGGGHDLGNALAIQSDGKILVAGTSHNGTNNDFALVRYNTDGSLDITFDTDGMVTTDLGNNDNGESIAIQSDGKIVVAGYSNAPGNFDFAVVRYNTDGSLDTTFDTDGMVTTNIDILHDRAYAVAIQSDGKIVVAGYARMSPSIPVNNDFALVRYNADGSLDTSFDTDGILTTSIGGSQDQPYAMAIQSDGKIVVAGYSNSGANYDFVVVRYNTDGSLDNNFDSDGIVTTAIRDKDDFAYGLAIQPDGKIVVAGYGTIVTAGNHDDFIVVRYNTDGSLDTGFDTDGKVVTDIALRNDHATSVALQSDGKIVVAGSSQNATDLDFGLVRYNSDGSLDTSFSTDGMVTTAILSSNDTASAVAIQADGKIVAAGRAQTASNNDFAVARYEGRTNAPPVAGDDAGVDYTTDEDTAFTTGNVLDNDTDPDLGDTLSVASFDTAVLTGTLTSNGDGTFDYDPNGMFESLAAGAQALDVFSYVVTDGVLTDTATVTVTVTGVNDAPVAGDDAGVDYTTDEDTPFTTGNVLDNDHDPDLGDSLSVASFDTAVLTGTLTSNGDGTFDYDPNGMFDWLAAGDQALDVFSYVVTDGVLTDTATVTITVTGVNDAPLVDPGADQVSYEGEEVIFSGSYTDPDLPAGPVADEDMMWNFGDGSTMTGTMTPSHTYLDEDVYTVTLTVTDTNGGVGQDWLRVTVENVAPVVDAGPDANLEEGQTFTRTGSFTDPGADTWTATVDYGTGAGPASLALVGKSFSLSQVYPAAGTYTVTVTVEDDDGGVGTDEVVVTVGQGPTADLEISQSLSIDHMDTIFTIVARNNGPDIAPGAVVSVTFPAAFTNVAWTCEGTNGATCTPSGTASGPGNTIHDTLSSFPSGGVVTFTVYTRVSGDAIYYNAAEVIPPNGVVDPDLANNYSTQASRYMAIFPLMYLNAPAMP